jgi:hypothetical protein
MARADLHNALVLDREIYDASQVDPSLLDPVVRPVAALPGPLRPFTVVREYQGPAGGYAEQFVLTDSAGTERYRSSVRRSASYAAMSASLRRGGSGAGRSRITRSDCIDIGAASTRPRTAWRPPINSM